MTARLKLSSQIDCFGSMWRQTLNGDLIFHPTRPGDLPFFNPSFNRLRGRITTFFNPSSCVFENVFTIILAHENGGKLFGPVGRLIGVLAQTSKTVFNSLLKHVLTLIFVAMDRHIRTHRIPGRQIDRLARVVISTHTSVFWFMLIQALHAFRQGTENPLCSSHLDFLRIILFPEAWTIPHIAVRSMMTPVGRIFHLEPNDWTHAYSPIDG